MIRLRNKFALALLCVFTQLVLSAQVNDVIVKFPEKKISLSDLIDQVEKEKNIQFYFKKEWIDSVTILIEQSEGKLVDILTKQMPKYGLHFYIKEPNRIYLSKEPVNQTLEPTAIYYTEQNYEQDSVFDEDKENVISSLLNEVVIGKKNNGLGNKANIVGVVKDAETGEPLLGVMVYIEELKTGTVTDINGNYMLNLKKGEYLISFRSVGKEIVQKKVKLLSSGKLNINLTKSLTALDEIVVKEERFSNLRSMQTGFEQISMKNIKELPPVAGERDILKASLLLPGVQTIGESAAGYNIRGGAADENLFLINNVPVYNTSHMFGFFSTFNPNVIRNFNLFKSNIPVEYGGRISSVFEIQTKNGNNKKFSLKGGISPITAQFSAEGPIVKDKSSYILGVRSTYSNWILKRIENPEIRNSDVYFHDIIANVSHSINDNNNIGVFAYFSKDNFNLPTGYDYNYGNIGASVNWQHFFGKKLYSKLALIYSNYNLSVINREHPLNAYKVKHTIDHYELNHRFNYNLNQSHEVKFGYSSILYKIEPGKYDPENANSSFESLHLENESALESAVYLGDKYDISTRFGVEGGVRYSFYNYLGPKTIFNYVDNERPSPSTLIDTSYYGNFKPVKSYSALDIRFSLRFLVNSSSSVKFSYNRITQYLFLLTNTIAISPSDKWKLSDNYSPPTMGQQYNLGFYKDFMNSGIEASAEIYYKTSTNLKDFKNGSEPEMNQHLERDLITGIGRTYGIELMLKKNYGKLSGWINYSYSKSEVQFKGSSLEETINNGSFFPSNIDKPHNINLTTNLKTDRRLSFSANFTYSTGRPGTFMESKTFIGNIPILNYSDRNARRLPDYWRVDVAVNLEGNLIRKKPVHAYWTFSIYNLTGRKNAYSVYFTNENGKVTGHKISIFAQPVFTLSYNFKLGNYASN